MLKTHPAVFAVGDQYQIMVPVTGESLLWVKVGGQIYCDESNGIMRSLRPIHRVIVPQEALNEAGHYTVCEKELIDRKPYFPTSRQTVETEYDFYPVPDENPRAYHISDAHNREKEPIRAAQNYGKIDFLIMNGDVPNDSGEISNFDTIYNIASEVTHGNIPIVFARGNHDLRGYHAEEIAEYTPNENGNTFYSFRLGRLWGLILDCGEDKNDWHEEYGGDGEHFCSVYCHGFRQRETKYIRNIIANAGREYEAEDVQKKLVIVHMPFVHIGQSPFNIEPEIYGEWAQLLADYIKPDLMICGHTHHFAKHIPGDKWYDFAPCCPVVVGSAPDHEQGFSNAGFVFEREKIQVCFANEAGETIETFDI